MKRLRGIMIIELLLVITLAAVIIFVGLREYRASHDALDLKLVQHDISVIRMALNRYYEQLVCDAAGVLDVDVNQDVLARLDVQPELQGRLPYIERYHAKIIMANAKTVDSKPIYKLVVMAKFADSYVNQMSWLRARLAAKSFDQQTLAWESLPMNTTAVPRGLLWVMNASRDQFRQLKNDVTLSQTQALHSHAYCAH